MKLALIGLALMLVAKLADGTSAMQKCLDKKKKLSLEACLEKDELYSLCMKLKIKVVYNKNFNDFVKANLADFGGGPELSDAVDALIARANTVLNSGSGLGPKKVTLELGDLEYDCTPGVVTWNAANFQQYRTTAIDANSHLRTHLTTDDHTLYIFFNYDKASKSMNGFTRQGSLCDKTVFYRASVINVDGSGLQANAENLAIMIAQNMGVTGPHQWQDDQCKAGYASRPAAASSWSTCAAKDVKTFFCNSEHMKVPRCWEVACTCPPKPTTG